MILLWIRRVFCVWAFLGVLSGSVASVHSALGQTPFRPVGLQDYLWLGGGGLLFLSGYYLIPAPSGYLENELEALSPKGLDRWEKHAIHHWSPRLNNLSEFSALVAGSAITALVFSPQARDDGYRLAIMTAQMLVWSTALPQIAKTVVQRNRPFIYNTHADLNLRMQERGRESFFSRTSTVAFASAVYASILFDTYFPQSIFSPWVWSGSMAFASMAAGLKYFSGQHFPTDIITGAALGSFIGWYVPHVSRNRNCNSISFFMVPINQGVLVGLNRKF